MLNLSHDDYVQIYRFYLSDRFTNIIEHNDENIAKKVLEEAQEAIENLSGEEKNEIMDEINH